MGGDSDQLGWVGRPNEARPTPIDPMKTVVGSGDTGTRKNQCDIAVGWYCNRRAFAP
jgi:hypothetical protein